MQLTSLMIYNALIYIHFNQISIKFKGILNKCHIRLFNIDDMVTHLTFIYIRLVKKGMIRIFKICMLFIPCIGKDISCITDNMYKSHLDVKKQNLLFTYL